MHPFALDISSTLFLVLASHCIYQWHTYLQGFPDLIFIPS